MADIKTKHLKMALATAETLFTEYWEKLSKEGDASHKSNLQILDDFAQQTDTAIAAIIADLATYYYKKVDLYNKTEIDDLLGSLARLDLVIVESVEDVTEAGHIYLVPKESNNDSDPETNTYYEYIYIESEERAEKIGSTDIDLSDYFTKEEVLELVSEVRDLFKVESFNNLNSTTFVRTNFEALRDCYKMLIESQNMTFYKTSTPNPYLTDEGILLDTFGFMLQDSITFICDLGHIKYLLQINEDTFITTLTTITV